MSLKLGAHSLTHDLPMPATEPQAPRTENGCEPPRQALIKRSKFYRRSGKRLLDTVVSGLGLLLLLPLFVAVSVASKLSSRGPVFYHQERVGRGGQTFSILKFRTMQLDADKIGPGITVQGDPRITTFGRILRSSKIDELPQLWNVFKGDMSLVGPRPELPCYVANYTPQQRAVLSVRPGITDAASLFYRHEEQLLARHSDPERHYRQIVLSNKLELNLAYLDGISFSHDMVLLFRTAWSIFFSSSEKLAH